ncbi:actin filament-associated protein 1-like 2 isoform X1 [Gopherus flavomarginatus]|uniref:actin filament-associated protein 1-like 2 isoform X1 n=2 Tax=Gopherus flavomarginatus TaxID=286002 RepID=UPI0021CBBFAE|nr:actin filament-associated protein 1-like 2 isoform X1 [Gopherus flavomarginatus]
MREHRCWGDEEKATWASGQESVGFISGPATFYHSWEQEVEPGAVRSGAEKGDAKHFQMHDLDKLLLDLESFLLILDRENLSYIAQAKKKSIAELLSRFQSPPSEDAEYMIMRCISPSSGSSTFQTPPDLSPRQAAILSPDPMGRGECDSPATNGQCSPGRTNLLGVLPHLPSLPAEDSYEEAEPISPEGHMSPAGGGDTDSSHYESYGEDEDCVKDRAHYIQWPSAAGTAEAPARPEAQLCGFLWRKRWLGQWAKQLFIVREHALLCYKCAKDLQPVLELDLRGCRVAYKAKRSKKMQHVLKITGAAAETLVMGFQSRQQAEDWRKVIEEVSSSPLSRPSAHSSPVLPSSEQGRNSHQVRDSQLGSDSDEENSQISPAAAGCISRKGGFPELLSHSPRRHQLQFVLSGSVLSPLPDGEGGSGGTSPNERLWGRSAGSLNVLLNGQWQKLWCRVEQGALWMFRDPSCTESPEYAVPLAGSNVTPGANTDRQHHIHISQQGREVAVLQTHSDKERDIWLKILQVEKEAEPASVYETSVPGDGPSSIPVGGLLLRRFPTPNTYMDDPFGQLTPVTHPSPVYSNVDILHQLQQSLDRATQDQTQRLPCALPDSAFSNPQSRAPEETAAPPASPGKSLNRQWVEVAPELKSRDFFQSQRTLMQPARKGAPDSLDFLIGKRAFPKLEEKVGQLERACRMKTRLKAGSEMNLLAIGKSLKGHIATATSSAGSEGSFLTPLLKRTTSTKSALRRAPSVVIIEKGKVLQKRKEWEMKSAM